MRKGWSKLGHAGGGEEKRMRMKRNIRGERMTGRKISKKGRSRRTKKKRRR